MTVETNERHSLVEAANQRAAGLSEWLKSTCATTGLTPFKVIEARFVANSFSIRDLLVKPEKLTQVALEQLVVESIALWLVLLDQLRELES